jgi:hypothetical protein
MLSNAELTAPASNPAATISLALTPAASAAAAMSLALAPAANISLMALAISSAV